MESNCNVCSKPATLNCSNCYKIKYCSKPCQVAHRKIHKIDCFPLKIERSDELGRYLVATRNIKQWEVILKEKPITVGPNLTHNNGDKICLGCLVVLEGPYHECSYCKWPVCNQECEQVESHAGFECKILSKEKFKFSGCLYTDIHVLRCLLLKTSDPKKWNHIISLQSNSNNPSPVDQADLVGRKRCSVFIQNICKLVQFSQEEIDHVRGVLSTNAFDHNYKSGRFLYNIASMAAHDCVPNTSRIIDEKSVFQFRASVDIKAGSSVSTFYTNCWVPTLNRQADLRFKYGFSCNCERCVDPTELGSFTSGIKCAVEESSLPCFGFLIPIEPLNESTDWSCNHCKRKSHHKTIDEFNTKFKNIMDSVSMETSLSWENLQSLLEILKSHESEVHPNHYTLVCMELFILRRIQNLLANCTIPKEQITNILNKYLAMCELQIEVYNIILPGFNSIRGELMVYQQFGMKFKLIITEQSPNNKLLLKRQMNEIENIRATALQILSPEPREDFKNIVEGLKNESDDILSLKLKLNI